MYRQDYPESSYPPPQPVRVALPQTVPYVTYTILAVTVLIYLAQLGSRAILGNDWPALLGMKINELILEGQLWRLFTPALLHSINPLHIGFNMYALVIFGAGLERFFGHGRFLLLYLAGAFAGNVLSFLLSPNPSLGASTATFGLIGAQAIFLYRHRNLFGHAREALQQILMIAGINFVIGLQPGIDNWGHLGGLLGGLIFTWFGGPNLRVDGYYPLINLTDNHGPTQVLTAVAIILFIFGALTLLGFWLWGAP